MQLLQEQVIRSIHIKEAVNIKVHITRKGGCFFSAAGGGGGGGGGGED